MKLVLIISLLACNILSIANALECAIQRVGEPVEYQQCNSYCMIGYVPVALKNNAYQCNGIGCADSILAKSPDNKFFITDLLRETLSEYANGEVFIYKCDDGSFAAAPNNIVANQNAGQPCNLYADVTTVCSLDDGLEELGSFKVNKTLTLNDILLLTGAAFLCIGVAIVSVCFYRRHQEEEFYYVDDVAGEKISGLPPVDSVRIDHHRKAAVPVATTLDIQPPKTLDEPEF